MKFRARTGAALQASLEDDKDTCLTDSASDWQRFHGTAPDLVSGADSPSQQTETQNQFELARLAMRPLCEWPQVSPAAGGKTEGREGSLGEAQEIPVG